MISEEMQRQRTQRMLQNLINFARRTYDSVKIKTELESKVKSVKAEIKNMRNKQFQRIFREFYCKGPHSLSSLASAGSQNYESKYNVSFDTMLMALFGEKRVRKFQQIAFTEKIARQ